MLEYNKRHHLVTIIKETNKDPKQLFRALNSILENKNENQLPKGTTNNQLTEDFADFFPKNRQDKEGFTNIPAYQPNERDTPKLKNFTTIAENQLDKNNKRNVNQIMPTQCHSNRQTKKDTRRLFTSINPHNEQITGNKPILQ